MQNLELILPVAFAPPCYKLIHLIDIAMSYRSMWLAANTDPKKFSKFNNSAQEVLGFLRTAFSA